MVLHAGAESARAVVLGNELVLDRFFEVDPEVVRYVAEAPDVEVAVHACLVMGARVLRVAGATLDGDVVQRQFDEMTVELERRIIEFGQRVDQSTGSLLDEEHGVLTVALRRWIEEVGTSLSETFDADSKKSAIAKLEKVMATARDEQVRAVRRLLDADNDESPLNRWRTEIVAVVKEQGKSIEGSLGELREQLAVQSAKAETFEQTAVKGLSYERDVMALIESVVTPHEDVAEFVGGSAGNDGSKVGDIVVCINPATTPGRSVRYVVEVKDRKLPLKRALDELDAAMRCRGADAALMVFSSQSVCPIPAPFQWFDHKAVVVVDKLVPDRSALRLACLWARWTALRDRAAASSVIDAEHLQSLIEAARLSLKTATSIRTDHTQARNAIDQAAKHLDVLIGEVRTRLDEFEAELSRAEQA